MSEKPEELSKVVPEVEPDAGPKTFVKAPPKKKDTLWIAMILALTAGCVWFLFIAPAIGLTGLLVALEINPDLFTPKTSVILRIDPTEQRTPDPQVMQEMVKTLQERSSSLGYDNVTVSLTGAQKDRTLVKLPKDMDYKAVITQITPVGLIELVDFGSNALPAGTLVRTDLEFGSLPKGEGPARHTILTNLAITEASVGDGKDSASGAEGSANGAESSAVAIVFFNVDPEASEILKQYTTENRGKYLAVVLDKKVVMTPMVNNIIPEGSIVIEGTDKEQANRLAAFMGTRPLPVLLVVEKVTQ